MIKERISLIVDRAQIISEIYLPQGDTEETYPTVCLCHGIPGRVKGPEDRGYQLLAERFCTEGFAAFIFNFRGAGESGGNFDILGWTRDLTAVMDFLFNQPWADKRKISINISGEYLTRDYLIGKQRSIKSEPSYTAKFQPYELDDINKGIIRLLTQDSRIAAVEIAKKLGISADSVIQRIRKLEKEKVITRYNIVLNHDKIDQIHYKVLIYLNNVSPEKIRSDHLLGGR